jgi:hypothetical protein
MLRARVLVLDDTGFSKQEKASAGDGASILGPPGQGRQRSDGGDLLRCRSASELAGGSVVVCPKDLGARRESSAQVSLARGGQLSDQTWDGVGTVG